MAKSRAAPRPATFRRPIEGACYFPKTSSLLPPSAPSPPTGPQPPAALVRRLTPLKFFVKGPHHACVLGFANHLSQRLECV